ncbi:MAG: hypothetical protein AB8D78_02590 [Akkermansiaceae bacterium]
MVLLSLLAIGMLSLSAVSLRSGAEQNAMSEARTNARLALVLALGELQMEMGPDMRVSASASILDENPETEVIDGVENPNWLASYESWGNWLNHEHEVDGSTIDIQSTYVEGREPMFRRWLVSLPASQQETIDTSRVELSENSSVLLVGTQSAGADLKNHVRAHLVDVTNTGRYAWWVGAENQKAKVGLAARTRDLATDEWAVAQGTTAQVGVGAMSGMEAIDAASEEIDQLVSRVFTLQTLAVPTLGVDDDATKNHFFDLTNISKGILTNVRSGGLKKDLSLLLDRNNDDLPSPYQFENGANVEPSIRPLSGDILAEGAVLPNRPFASWPAMRHYYRMYRVDSDTTLSGSNHSGGHGSLSWDGETPYTEVLSPRDFRDTRSAWTGEDAYLRLPIIAKLTFLHSIKTEPNPDAADERLVRHLFSPVVTLWNPYNTEMRFPSGIVGMPAAINHSWPTRGDIYRDGARGPSSGASGLGSHAVFFSSESGAEITLNPGELKVFSYRDIYADSNDRHQLYPGFDPSAIGGVVNNNNRSYPEDEIEAQKIGIRITFDSYFGWNRQNGHTPGSLSAGLLWGNQFYHYMPNLYQIDWFNTSQTLTNITDETTYFSTSDDPVLVGYTQLALKGFSQSSYETINWKEDWRVRNWIQSPPFYFGNGLYMSEDASTAHTQRLDSPYAISFGPVSALELPKVVGHIGEGAFLGSGTSPYEKVTAVPALELPTAPISSLAGFSGMRMSPGWIWSEELNPDVWMRRGPRFTDNQMSKVSGNSKRVAYQSGITGPGIGNSFMHPMIPRTGIYKFYNNSISHDQRDGVNSPIVPSDTKAYSDFWDHVFLLNDALWDDYYVSTLANQTRPGAPNSLSISANLDRLISGEPIANPRYEYYDSGVEADDFKQDLEAENGFLKSAAHLMVDGSFNVNSTSVDAWYALFAGIRERQIYYRKADGSLEPVEVPASARIALSRFEIPNADEEVTNPAIGVTRDDGNQTWSGVRFLTDDHLVLLAEKCVEQVKRRGPFLNFSEFINRRLSDDELGVMGALQTAIDFDDESPDPASINYLYKRSSAFMIEASDLDASDSGVDHEFQTPEAAVGSRLAGTPGYVIQSDLLKPIASTLTVRDDTFRIRAYGESLDNSGNLQARAWCEALVQRIPDYYDPSNSREVSAQQQNSSGDFESNPSLTEMNRLFGRKFKLVSFRWLNASEI